MRTIKVSDSVWEELTLLKVKLKVKSYDEVVKYLLSNVVKTESATVKQEVRPKEEVNTQVTKPEVVEPKVTESKEELISASYLEEYVKYDLVPKLKKYVYNGSRTKLVWDLSEFRKLIESLTNLPVNDVIEAMSDLELIEILGNQVVVKLR